MNPDDEKSERKSLDIVLIIGVGLFLLGILIFFFLDQLMFGHVTIIGPIVIFLGIAIILLDLGSRIRRVG